MADVHSRETRSRNMRAIGSRNTKPELYVRSLLHRSGFRFRIEPDYLPSKVDIYLPKYRVAVFVHGCFWHGHSDCHLFRLPGTRTEFWREKIASNTVRDERQSERLLEDGLRVLTVWECALKGKFRLTEEQLADALNAFMLGTEESSGIRGSAT